MKIGIVSPYYMHAYGGVQTLVKGLSKHLIDKGHDVYIIAPKPSPEYIEKTPERVYLLGVSREVNFKALFHTTLPLAATKSDMIADFLNEENFDVLNIHEPWMPLLPYQILQEAACPIVGTTHGRWPKTLINQSLEKMRMPYFRFILSKIDLMTAVSEVSARNVSLVNPEFDLKIVPNAIDLKELSTNFTQAKKSDSKPYMLYLNRLEKRKGPKLLIKAYHKYVLQTTFPIIPLIIAGSGPQELSLINYVKKHNLEHLVSFEGFVSNERKYELFANAQLYISPAPYGESFGIVLLESMAADVPIIAGDNSGYRTVLKDNGARSLINPYNTADFAILIDQFCNHDQTRRTWKNWAKKAIKQYDYPVIVDQYEACFEKAIKRFNSTVKQ